MIRVGSTWSMDAIPSHPVYIVNDGYVTGLKDDGVASRWRHTQKQMVLLIMEF